MIFISERMWDRKRLGGDYGLGVICQRWIVFEKFRRKREQLSCRGLENARS
jgi:hypothetical protein